ncbi:cellulose biosynthesis protein BcsO [Dickeya zeae]|uniref:Cellulose biosynthesis protein BcsO n=1 Tax=Dickeya zeae TaxID=204042 RepID=A0ABX8W105_9GAMM|nr:cellulose biosynthesis protein BcsO [Dickeya zeae]QYM92880.1 cellulose biosynthesis protein BcsO [Dickeya zeae]
MNSYDDMQRFKDKAQIKDINFRDMSGQVMQSDTVVWPIMKQLLRNQADDDSLSGAQTVDMAQPVPASLHALSATAPTSPRHVAPPSILVPDAPGDDSPSLLNAVAASLPPAGVAPAPQSQTQLQPQLQPPIQPQSPQPAIAASHAVLQPEAVRPHPLSSASILSVPVTNDVSMATDTGRFRQLFNVQRHDETHSVSKTMLLKPLLEKIALCR